MKIYILTIETGEYEDNRVVNHKAFFKREEAEKLKEKLKMLENSIQECNNTIIEAKKRNNVAKDLMNRDNPPYDYTELQKKMQELKKTREFEEYEDLVKFNIEEVEIV